MIERWCCHASGCLWPLENIGVQKATWAAAGGKEACPDVLEGEDQDEDHDKDEEDEEENSRGAVERSGGGSLSMSVGVLMTITAITTRRREAG